MKVGILSINMYTPDLNWASRIHTYAFQQFLDQHGIDNVIIDYLPNYCNRKFDLRHPYDYYLAHPKKDPEEQAETLTKWKTLYEEREERYDRIQAFIDRYYRKTSERYDQKSLNKKDPGCDIYICATDVLWRYRPRGIGFDKGFFLDCKAMEGKGKIAYSVAKGGNRYTPEQMDEFKGLIQDFDYISVREKSLYNNMLKNCDQPVSLVVDPIFLQEPEFYDPICKKPEEKGYVLIYLVMKSSPDLVKRAVAYAQEHNLQLIELSDYPENRYIPEGTEHPVKYGLGVEDWLGYIKYADCIFTNSFHCSCFSILFHKQFYAGSRSGGKVRWVLEMFGVYDRWIKAGQPLATGFIDYGPVEELRVKYKERSGQYILDAIEDVSWRLEHPEEAKQTPKKELKGIEDLLPPPPSEPEPEPTPKPPKKPKPLWKRALRKVKRLLS